MQQFPHAGDKRRQQGFTGVQVLLIVLAVVLITALASFYVIKTYIFPSPFTPVALSQDETRVLDNKLAILGWESPQPAVRESGDGRLTRSGKAPKNNHQSNDVNHSGESSNHYETAGLQPEPYRELPADRLVSFNEREVNAMIARNPDFAQRVAIDFSDDLASAKILIPIPDDFPVMPGQILRVSTGLDIRLGADKRPVIALVGVSVMGVPIPNAWLGNIKNVNLVNEFGSGGFWTSFADGVEYINVTDGQLNIKLRP